MDKDTASSALKPLTQMKKGEKGIIADYATNDGNILKKLMSLGILPGSSLEVVQTFPAYVFQAGYTQVAVDREIASVILVNTPE